MHLGVGDILAFGNVRDEMQNSHADGIEERSLKSCPLHASSHAGNSHASSHARLIPVVYTTSSTLVASPHVEHGKLVRHSDCLRNMCICHTAGSLSSVAAHILRYSVFCIPPTHVPLAGLTSRRVAHPAVPLSKKNSKKKSESDLYIIVSLVSLWWGKGPRQCRHRASIR